MSDTIFALSSGAPPAAIATVRISGPGADTALQALAGRLPQPRRLELASVRHDGELLDRALVVRFPGPESSTGEDVAELHLHGGRSVVAAVLSALGALAGLRAAEPGEFTRRAFGNGRIDLAEAEGLADLLAAETQSQRRAALALAGGALSRQIEAWQARILAAAAHVEAELDFGDETDVSRTSDEAFAEVERLAHEITAWQARPSAERLRDGVRVVIAGPPNAGKSSLLNALTGREAAITSPLEGTTRDLVEAPTAIEGAPFLLIDTAGLREEGSDGVETIGIERARQALATADVILWLGEPADSPDPKRAVLVHAKNDIRPPDPRADISISVHTGSGIESLTTLLVRRAQALLPAGGEVALNARHKAALGDCAGWLREAGSSSDLLVVAEALRHARGALDRVTGRAGVEDMLDCLFGRFCIGK